MMVDSHLLMQSVSQAKVGLLLTEQTSRILFVNKHFTNLIGYEASELIGKTPKLWRSSRHDLAFYTKLWEELDRKGCWSGELWNRRKSGESYLQSTTISRITSENGELFYLGVMCDVTEWVSKVRKAEYKTNYDLLTGLPNRLIFEDRLQAACDYCKRTRSITAVVFIDLDGFGMINDTLGYDVGDSLLRTVAERLRGVVRQTDTVARLGETNFAIIITDLGTEKNIDIIMRNIKDKISKVFSVNGHDIYISISAGVTFIPTDGSDAQALSKKTRLALGAAKEIGSNTIRFFTDELNAMAIKRSQIEGNLRGAIEKGELYLEYQPILDAAKHSFIGAEVLLRWRHPVHGIVGPEEFIEVAEDTGLIVSIGQWVLDQTITTLTELKALGFSQFKLAVNISTRQLRDPGSFEVPLSRLTALGLSPALLEMEIEEAVLREKSPHVFASLQTLSKFGIGLAIDDFGVGFTSLRVLRNFPLKCLKIDRIFLSNFTPDDDSAVVMAAMIAAANSLGIPIVGKGVESEQQIAFLKAKGCNYMQGFMISRPMDKRSLYAWLSSREQPPS
jgi:diguanylate cyclase (GGDEF)-like protein/PAS domain S-box-containing protein